MGIILKFLFVCLFWFILGEWKGIQIYELVYVVPESSRFLIYVISPISYIPKSTCFYLSFSEKLTNIA